ncbi:hypothetical protein IWQ61_007933 [Dispira simplex]|nr:hypothetical protein IWQ61_007933 [Dispira simplex]
MAKPFFKILWPWLALIKLSLSLPTHHLLPNGYQAPNNEGEHDVLPDDAVPLRALSAIRPRLANDRLHEPSITHSAFRHRAPPPSNDDEEVSSTLNHITDDDTDYDSDDGWDNGSDGGLDDDTDDGLDDDVLSDSGNEEEDVPDLTDGESEIDPDNEDGRLHDFPGASTLTGYFPPGTGAPQ